MKATETVIEALEPKVHTDRDVLPNLVETASQNQYADLVTLLAELEAEGFFAELDSVTFAHDRLLSATEEVDGREQYEALTRLLAELEAEGFFKDLDATTYSNPRAQWSLQHLVTKLIQPIAAMRTKTIACFDSHTTLAAKVACTLGGI